MGEGNTDQLRGWVSAVQKATDIRMGLQAWQLSLLLLLSFWDHRCAILTERYFTPVVTHRSGFRKC